MVMEYFRPLNVKMLLFPFYYENSGIVFQCALGKTEAFGNDDAYAHVCFLLGSYQEASCKAGNLLPAHIVCVRMVVRCAFSAILVWTEFIFAKNLKTFVRMESTNIIGT